MSGRNLFESKLAAIVKDNVVLFFNSGGRKRCNINTCKVDPDAEEIEALQEFMLHRLEAATGQLPIINQGLIS